VISLKQFLTRPESDHEEFLAAQARMISLVLDGIVVHAVRGSPADYVRFEADLAGVRDEITREKCSPGDLLVKTGTALKAMQDYNRRTADFSNAQAVELQKITSMLAGAIANLSIAGSTSVTRLQAIERQLEQGTAIDDVRLLKEKLSECLVGIREEKLRQQTVSDSAVSEYSEGLRTARTLPFAATPQAPDTSTRLKSRPCAEMAVASAADGVSTVFGAIFIIDHLHRLNTRFGRTVGDQIITLFTQHLAQRLRPEDSIFRWSGPAFLVLLQRDEPLERVRRELAPIASARLEKTVEIKDRTVLLPLNFSWTVMPVPLAGKASVAIDKFDAFVSSKIGVEV